MFGLKPYDVLISAVVVISGTASTIISKWMDEVEIDKKKFEHPFFQAACMFLGEVLCFFAFWIKYWLEKRAYQRSQVHGDQGTVLESLEEPSLPKFNPLIFLPPACCDIMASSLIYMSLNLTSASNVSMLRGAVLVFTSLLSILFLKMRFPGYKWLGIGFLTVGLVVVGVTDMLFDNDESHDVHAIIIGNAICILAQFIQSIQIVTEQKYLQVDDVPPLLAVGLEGIYGLTITSLMMIPMYFIKVPETFSDDPEHRLENVLYAFWQMGQQPILILFVILTVLNIAILNFSSLAFTKRFSGATRLVLSSVSTLTIWLLSMPLFGEEFMPLKILGFALLIIGMMVYNDTLFGPKYRADVLPRQPEGHCCTLCCLSFCGVGADLEENDQARLLNQQED